MKKQYLGDGVYVDVQNGMIHLVTEDGIRVTNEIFLESEVWVNLMQYVRNLDARLVDPRWVDSQ